MTTRVTVNETGSGIDHGLLTGLGDDDHPQYTRKDTLTAEGDFYVRSGGAPARLPVGATLGHGLISNGPGTPPSWTQLFSVVDSASINLTYNVAAATLTAAVLPAGVDHGGLAGLTDDDHSQYALLAGRSGGQTLIGGTAAGDVLTLKPSSDGSPTGDLIINLQGAGQVVRFIPPTSSAVPYTGLAYESTETQTIAVGGQFRALAIQHAITMAGAVAGNSFVCFNFNPVITLDAVATTNLASGAVYQDTAEIHLNDTTTAYGAAGAWRSFRALSNLTARAVGTSTATLTALVNFQSATTFGLGWTTTLWQGLDLQTPSGAGTITTMVGVDIEDFAGGSLTITNPPMSLRSQGVTVEMRHGGPGVFGANAAPTNAQVGLEVQSTTKAFLLPRLTNAQVVTLTAAGAVDGMCIYVTDAGALAVGAHQRIAGAWQAM